jgi:hypothetical protein
VISSVAVLLRMMWATGSDPRFFWELQVRSSAPVGVRHVLAARLYGWLEG